MKRAIRQDSTRTIRCGGDLSGLPKNGGTYRHQVLLPHRDVVLVIGAIWKFSAPLTDMLALVFLVLGASGSGKVRLAHWD